MRLRRLIALAALGSAGFCASSAQALPPVHGAVDGRALLGVADAGRDFDSANRYGGAISADLWLGEGRLRFGGAFGVGALSGHGPASSRVFTPLGLSVALLPREDAGGPTLALRLGGYAGGQKGGFTGGGWGSLELGYRFAIGEGASVRAGLDAWAFVGPNGGVFVGPYLGLGY